MRFGLLQINPTVGDLDGNADKIRDAAVTAHALGAEFCLTPELALIGYPPRDLLLDHGFVNAAQKRLTRLAHELSGLPPVLVGAPEINPGHGRPLFNGAALLHKGQIQGRFRKTLLPTYDVFDEDRWFEPGSCPGVIEYGGLTLGVTICEDIWNDKRFWERPRYASDPVETLAGMGADVILNLSSSPFVMGKQAFRARMIGEIARRHDLPVLYCNQVGGNDELIFAGQSMAFARDGRLIGRAASFAEDVLLVQPQEGGGSLAPDPAESGAGEHGEEGRVAEAWGALVLGTRDYVRKCGFSDVVLGLSGGIDSSLVAAIAAEALGAERVHGVRLPSRYSSPGSLSDAEIMAGNLGLSLATIPIQPLAEGFDLALSEAFAGRKPDVTEENLQARIRGNLLMALSNKFGWMLLTTGNKSELAVGYCTIYGDMSGGLAVISDAPKTLVYALARYCNRLRGEVIPQAVLEKAPSAELRPDQKDQDSLPPYDLLDEILENLVDRLRSPDEVAKTGKFDPALVERVHAMVVRAEFKRRQAAPGLKITDRAFGTGWRMPIAAKAPWWKGN